MTGDIRNVVIFVSDALRWDYTPKEIKRLGHTFKTVAQSCHTPTSFASIVSGLNPPKHGVEWFSDTISKNLYTIFDLPINSSYYSFNKYDPVYRVLGNPPRISLKNLREPFVYLEKNVDTHAPYNPNYKGTAKDYSKEYRKKPGIYIRDYEIAVEKSCNEFFDRIRTLKKRGLLDRTLLIYTSDHGEFLGEYGFPGHEFPCAPELVYVPTVFIHQSLDNKDSFPQIIRHVDILPTILDLLEIKVNYPFEGVNVFTVNDPLLGYCRTTFPYLSPWKIVVSSVWNEQGGYVKLIGATWRMLIILLQELLYRSQTFKPFTYCKRVQQFGEPLESVEEKIINVFENKYTYGYANMIHENPLNQKKAKELGMKLRLRKKIRKLKSKNVLKSEKNFTKTDNLC